ncbi:MAG: 2-C-methyl-D-erythritol 2,4-cyclodiphosphate synthase [Candidatus Omnitrophota bacterium]
MAEYKVGFGYDIHRLVANRKLILGGVQIPYSKGLFGHSDADVLIHAICDAILGAIGKPDIGELFPNTDKRYKNIASSKLLEIVVKLMKKCGFSLVNLDTVIIAEVPKISRFKDLMKNKIVGILNIKKDNINIKASTNEGISQIGSGKAIAAYAVVLLVK